jgi:peptide methionine sulfoxide reductase msrA/msrB
MTRSLVFAGLATLVLAGALAATLRGVPGPGTAPAPGSPPAAERTSTPRWKESGQFVKPSDEELKKRLTPLQYDVTQHDGTERAFSNEYWNEHRDGIYVDIVSGEPLFSSKEKFDSGTGWPSFWTPLEPANVKQGPELSVIQRYSEVRSAHADSHLGHVFHDGPQPTGLRYCIDSASLKFIPVEDLEKEGYGKYAGVFGKK